jgi:hypothetical protein
MTHVIVTDSRDAVETVCAPSLLDCSQDPKGSLDEPDLSITPPGPPPAGKHYNMPPPNTRLGSRLYSYQENHDTATLHAAGICGLGRIPALSQNQAKNQTLMP